MKYQEWVKRGRPDPQPQFVCPVCDMASWNPGDRINGWCSACQSYTDQDASRGRRKVLSVLSDLIEEAVSDGEKAIYQRYYDEVGRSPSQDRE